MAIPHSSQQNDAERPADLHPLGGEASKPKKSGWLWILALIVLAGGAYYYYKSRPSSESKAAPAPGARAAALGPVSVAVTPALKQNVPYYLSGLGSVTAFNTVTVKSRVDGELEKVNFKEGQFVHEGDLLAEIDPRPFQVALEQMEGQLFRDQAQLDNARVDFKRYDQLAKEGVIASQQVDTQNATVGQTGRRRARRSGANRQRKIAIGLLQDYGADQRARRAEARRSGQHDSCHGSEWPGRHHASAADRGSFHAAGRQPSGSDPAHEKRGAGRRSVQPRRSDQAGDGQALTVDNQIDPTTGTVRFKAAFENRDLSLWPNQFVNTRLMLAMRKDAIVVPLAAIQRGTQGSYVYTVKGGKANMQPVKVDLTQGNIALIATGVSVGDQVVVDGQERLQSGTPVEVHNASPGGPAGRLPAAPAPGKDSDPSSDTEKQKAGKAELMNPSRPFILRPIATSLLMAAILLAGAVAYRQLPVSALPQVDYPTIQVLTFYPGASPSVMASSVTTPLERQFGQVPGLNQMTSTSSFGASLITLQFVLDLNIDVAEQQVQAAINAATTYLPTNLPNPPIYSKTNPADTPVLTLALTSDTLPLTKLEDMADTVLSQKIAQLPGVGLVSISGGQKPSVRIQANPTALASYGLSLEDLRTALGQANVNQAKGNLDSSQQAFTIWANDQLMTADSYKPIVIAYKNGAPGPHHGRGQRHRQRGKRQTGGLGKRQARRDRQHSKAAGREHHQRSRPHQEPAAATEGVAAVLGPGFHSDRPHHHDPRFRFGRAIRVDADRGAGRARHLFVSAQPGGDRHPQRGCAPFARGHVRRDVFARLQSG